MKKTGITAIDMLLSICKTPDKYRNVINVPTHQNAVQALIELGYKVPFSYMHPYAKFGQRTPIPNSQLSIATEAARELNMN